MRILRTYPRIAYVIIAGVLLGWFLWSCNADHPTQAKYDSIQVGETKSAVEDTMGSPDGHGGPEESGEECLYWLMPNNGLQGEDNWMVCFRDGKVTRKMSHP